MSLQRILCLWLVLLFSAATSAQSEPKVSAVLSSGVIKLGGDAQLIIVVEGARAPRILGMPEPENVHIESPGAPMFQQSVQIIQGRRAVWRTHKWILRVRPLAEGDLQIPAIRIDVDGKEVLTEALDLKAVKDMRGEQLGYIEILKQPTRVYEGQPFMIDLRFGWDEDLGVSAARLILPWWGKLSGTLDLPEPPQSLVGQRQPLNLNSGSRIMVDDLPVAMREGREFRTLRLRHRMLATRRGSLDFPTSWLEFKRVIRAGSGGIFGPANEYENFYVQQPAFSIEVLPIPEKDRPFEWTGAVGTLASSRRVDRRDVDAGDSIKLTVTWTGEGNLEFFEPPDLGRLDEFSGFRVLGSTDKVHSDERRVTYDLVPRTADVSEIPPVPLWTFDPETHGYRSVDTEPVSIRVRALEPGMGLSDEGGDSAPRLDIRDIQGEPSDDEGLMLLSTKGLLGGMFGLPVLWLLGRLLVRRGGDPNAPAARRRRVARRSLVRELKSSRDANDQTEAFCRFLARRSGEGPHAWVGREVVLAAPDLAAELAVELQDTLDRLDRANWAEGEQLQASQLLAVADRLIRGGL